MKKGIKKGKITMTITIGIACFALVTVMMMQFKIVNETDITSIENMQEAELKTELANWKSKYDDINAKYEDTKSKIEEYKNDEQSSNESSKHITGPPLYSPEARRASKAPAGPQRPTPCTKNSVNVGNI